MFMCKAMKREDEAQMGWTMASKAGYKKRNAYGPTHVVGGEECPVQVN